MVYIKKLVLQGFKSFARRTEIILENSMNVIVGPNGSGKSNITDAICFALGRMSKKSMRAEKIESFLFSGNKYYKPANEALVEIVFEDKENVFLADKKEVSIKRIVKRNGVSIYKLNDETKTRQEIIEILAKAGIDPDGFNIVLQGEIGSLIKISSEERRKIIEEVAGISFYELRKEKSLKELEKTEEKLKETTTILKEKLNYLKNLEEERKNALEFKRIEENIKKHKATILFKEISEKEKEILFLEEEKEKNNKKIASLKEKYNQIKIEISICEEKIKNITKEIEEKTSGEQDLLYKEISDLKAELAGLNVRRENYENRIKQNKIKVLNLKNRIENLEKEISLSMERSPQIKNKREKKKELEDNLSLLEKKRREFYLTKNQISLLESKKEEKLRLLFQTEQELKVIDQSLNKIFLELKFCKNKHDCEKLKKEIELSLFQIKNEIIETEKRILSIEKENAVLEKMVQEEDKILKNLSSLEICPLCKSKITEEHKLNVINEAKQKISFSENKLNENSILKKELQKILQECKIKLEEKQKILREVEIEKSKIIYAEEKEEKIKILFLESEDLKKQIEELNKNISKTLFSLKNLEGIEEKYNEVNLQLKELSFEEEGLDINLIDKRKDIERIKVEISSIDKDDQESEALLSQIIEKIKEREKELLKKEEKEREVYERFNSLYLERNKIADKQKEFETSLIGLQNEIRNIEDKNNSFKLKEAEINAKLETLREEFSLFKEVELIQGSKESLGKNLFLLQEKLRNFGSINMKAIEVYDNIKFACNEIQAKVDIILKEKEKILEVISEIDKKKRKTFLKTLEAINSLFARNFSQLSRKGEIFLELENMEDPFAGGLEIILKVAKGKYFDISSLSGGEKALVALSLIFAIQEYKPYCFYIFDEIDAPLDKHNSELLASLIKRYMVSGQYIIVTHNDVLIEHAPVLYGVSMQEGISKIVSQKF